MAKVTKETTAEETKAVATQSNAELIAELLASMTPEEREEIAALTGQNANSSGDRIPVLKINYCDTPDTEGKEIKKGNFVYDQSSATVEVEVTDEDGDVTKEERMENLGTDLGKSIQVTALAYRQQYNYYNNDDNKLNCRSQVFGAGEVPVGSNLKHECRGGKCPRRKEGIDKKDKCSCQFIVYVLVKVGEETKPAMMYIKGASYFPFNDYLKAAGPIPLYFAPTKMKTSVEKQGAVTYYPLTLTLDIPNAYPAIERDAYKEQMKGAVAQMDEHKKMAVQKSASKQIVDKSEGPQTATTPFDIEDDTEIVF